MEVINFLKTHGLQKLKDDFKIVVNQHPNFPLLLLNYDAVDARENKLEYHPITRDCRSLVLDGNTFDLVSRSFRKFYKWVHKLVNIMKSDYEQRHFIKWCELIYKHSLLKEQIPCNPSPQISLDQPNDSPLMSSSFAV